jgi:hypothetical protein
VGIPLANYRVVQKPWKNCFSEEKLTLKKLILKATKIRLRKMKKILRKKRMLRKEKKNVRGRWGIGWKACATVGQIRR